MLQQIFFQYHFSPHNVFNPKESIMNSNSTDHQSRVHTHELTIIAKGAGIVFLGTIIGTGLKYLFELITARYLGVNLFGLFFLGLAVFRIGEILAAAGMQSGILRYVSIFYGRGDWQRIRGTVLFVLRIVILSCLITSGSFIFFAKGISVNIFHKTELSSVLKALAVAIPFSVITTISVFSFQAIKSIKYKVYVKDLLEPFSRILFVIIIILLGWSLLGVIAAFVLSIVVGTIAAYHYLRKLLPQLFDRRIQPIYQSREIFKYSWPLFFVGFLNLLFLWTSTLLIGYFRTSQEVGLYNAAYRTALLGQIVLFSFSSIFAPFISDLFDRKETRQLENLYKITAKWVLSLSLPLFLIMVIFAKEILTLFGKEFVRGASCLIILSIAQLVNSGTGSSQFMISMTGRSKINLFNTVTTLLMNIVLNIILIPKHGIIGAAVATAVSISLINILSVAEVYIIYRIHPYRLDFLKSLAGSALPIAVLCIAKNTILTNVNYLLSLVLGSLTYIGLYGLILYLLGINEEEKSILGTIKAKLKTSWKA